MVAAVAIPVVVFLLHARRFGQWIVDDAGITFAYARSIADGHGLVQQPGADPVEGFSNPLWTVLLAVAKKLTLFDSGRTLAGWPDYVLLPRVLALVCFVAILALLHRAFVPLVGDRAWLATLLTGLGLALNPSYVIWAVSGLENPLYGLLIAALAAVLVRAIAVPGRLTDPRAAVTLGVLALLLAVSRPEGIVYAAAYPLALGAVVTRGDYRAALRSLVLAVGVTVVPMGVFLLARHAVFGKWLPNTATAKDPTIKAIIGLDKVDQLETYIGWPLTVVAVVIVGLAIGSAVGRSAHWPGVLGLAVCLLLAMGAFAVLPHDWMSQYRFATPVWVTGTALVAVCAVGLIGSGALSVRASTALAVLAAASIAFTTVGLSAEERNFLDKPTVPLCWVADRFGQQFNHYADRLGVQNGSLAAPDLGGTLLTSRLRVIDVAGLTDPKIATLRERRDWDGLGDYILGTVRPTFIHFHNRWGLGLRNDPRLARDYVEILPGSDFVRRDIATRRPRAVEALRAEARTHRGPGKMASCGDRLTIGST
jgi:hypothetical protein